MHDIGGHGFGKDTIILSCRNDLFCLEHMFTKGYRPHHVVTFDVNKREHPHKKIAAIQPGTTNCYIRISVNSEPSHDIICTPSQEFYLPDQNTWAEACTLKVGDHLLGKVFEHIPITSITFHAEPCDIYLVEVEEPHTFFVGVYSVLTKNMILPCITIGYGVPLGCGTGSGLLSTFLGATLTGSVCFILGGAAIGYVIKRCMANTDPHHDFIFDITNIASLFQFQDKDDPIADDSVTTQPTSPETPYKTIEEILKGARPGKKTYGPSTIFEKPGTYQHTEEDFDSLELHDKKAIKCGRVGTLPDGRKVVARWDSDDGRPTLEIQGPNKQKIKIRYGEKSHE